MDTDKQWETDVDYYALNYMLEKFDEDYAHTLNCKESKNCGYADITLLLLS